MRKDCALSKLTDEQQADLFDWLHTDTYESVLKRMAQPVPDGFGIKTHINSLHRFYQQRQAELRALDLANLLPRTQDSGPRTQDFSPPQDFRPSGEPSSSGGPEGEELRQSFENAQDCFPTQDAGLRTQNCENANRFHEAAKSAFSHSTYVLANSPSTPATYRSLSRTLHQHDDIAVKREFLDVARQQLALSSERLQFDKTQFEYNAARAALALLPELTAIDQTRDIDDEAKIWKVRTRLFGASPSSTMQNDQCSTLNDQCLPQSVASARSAVQNDLK
ncbi:MAG TPA: hypothetical protein VM680_17290 [Verrucomicrobiae bacterium]|nr:hypothetical protein [Verrucomicrobiae bacterium]